MSEQILEIGAGRHPAIINPGTLFTENDAEYTGLDSDLVSEPMGSNYFDTKEKVLLSIKKVICNAASIPLPNASFDHVIYRSVFGQFTPNNFWPETEPPRQISFRQSWKDIIASLTEARRLLKPGGTLCIAEEDTPVPVRYLKPEIKTAGFKKQRIYESGLFSEPGESLYIHGNPITGNSDWLEMRGRYWSNRPMSKTGFLTHDYRVDLSTVSAWSDRAFNGSFGSTKPYIITATAPLK